MRILITAGGTQERIDDVRSISNTSTGATALFIAQALFLNGYQDIIYIHARKSTSFEYAKKNVSFVSSHDLEKTLKEELASHDIDIIIHAAAVSDFVVDKVVINGDLFEPETVSKLNSLDNIELVLKRRSKIIESLKSYSRKPNPLVIGFKLTNTDDPLDQRDQVFRLSTNDYVDFVVQNNLSEISTNQHPTNIYFKDTLLYQGQTKDELARNIIQILKTYAFNINESRRDLI